MKNKLVPALIGGASIFLLSLVLSLIPRAGFYTCVLNILGGVLAAYLYVKKSPTPVSGGEGIIVGAMAGFVTGLLRLAYLSITFLLNREKVEAQLEQFQERIRQAGANFSDNGLLLIILAGVILAVVMFVVLEAIGGAIGVALFEKRKGETEPPPPPPTAPADADSSLGPGE